MAEEPVALSSVGDLTVSQLRCELRSRNRSAKGRKKDLQNRLRLFLQKGTGAPKRTHATKHAVPAPYEAKQGFNNKRQRSSRTSSTSQPLASQTNSRSVEDLILFDDESIYPEALRGTPAYKGNRAGRATYIQQYLEGKIDYPKGTYLAVDERDGVVASAESEGELWDTVPFTRYPFPYMTRHLQPPPTKAAKTVSGNIGPGTAGIQVRVGWRGRD